MKYLDPLWLVLSALAGLSLLVCTAHAASLTRQQEQGHGGAGILTLNSDVDESAQQQEPIWYRFPDENSDSITKLGGQPSDDGEDVDLDLGNSESKDDEDVVVVLNNGQPVQEDDGDFAPNPDDDVFGLVEEGQLGGVLKSDDKPRMSKGKHGDKKMIVSVKTKAKNNGKKKMSGGQNLKAGKDKSKNNIKKPQIGQDMTYAEWQAKNTGKMKKNKQKMNGMPPNPVDNGGYPRYNPQQQVDYVERLPTAVLSMGGSQEKNVPPSFVPGREAEGNFHNNHRYYSTKTPPESTDDVTQDPNVADNGSNLSEMDRETLMAILRQIFSEEMLQHMLKNFLGPATTGPLDEIPQAADASNAPGPKVKKPPPSKNSPQKGKKKMKVKNGKVLSLQEEELENGPDSPKIIITELSGSGLMPDTKEAVDKGISSTSQEKSSNEKNRQHVDSADSSREQPVTDIEVGDAVIDNVKDTLSDNTISTQSKGATKAKKPPKKQAKETTQKKDSTSKEVNQKLPSGKTSRRKSSSEESTEKAKSHKKGQKTPKKQSTAKSTTGNKLQKKVSNEQTLSSNSRVDESYELAQIRSKSKKSKKDYPEKSGSNSASRESEQNSLENEAGGVKMNDDISAGGITQTTPCACDDHDKDELTLATVTSRDQEQDNTAEVTDDTAEKRLKNKTQMKTKQEKSSEKKAKPKEKTKVKKSSAENVNSAKYSIEKKTTGKVNKQLKAKKTSAESDKITKKRKALKALSQTTIMTTVVESQQMNTDDNIVNVAKQSASSGMDPYEQNDIEQLKSSRKQMKPTKKTVPVSFGWQNSQAVLPAITVSAKTTTKSTGGKTTTPSVATTQPTSNRKNKELGKAKTGILKGSKLPAKVK